MLLKVAHNMPLIITNYTLYYRCKEKIAMSRGSSFRIPRRKDKQSVVNWNKDLTTI